MDNPFNLGYHSPENANHLVTNPHTPPAHVYVAYRSIAPSGVDPIVQQHPSASMHVGAQIRPAGSPSPRLARQNSIRSFQSSPRIQRTGTPTSAVGRAAYSMSPPPLAPSFEPSSRSKPRRLSTELSLPSREINADSIDDAYVSFILYANPAVPKDVDTTELRRAFRSPPRSDGKTFSTYILWQLVSKFEKKELKTWSQLAIELGVEPPSTEKGQSTQKIQQYAVRLKRWMRAMHVDAFFEYCLGKPHRYYTQIPTSADEISESSRDGVPLEEDLAVRALMPEWRPKRGRRKADDKESYSSSAEQVSKRPRLDSSPAVVPCDSPGHSVAFPQSAVPWSAFPDDIDNQDGWNLASALPAGGTAAAQPLTAEPYPGRGESELLWRRDRSPSAYPQSAITPDHRQIERVALIEPQSAITPSSGAKSRSRRRHGPAVSSAWPGSNSASTGKLRGRPPTHKQTQDGSYSTFPANPKTSGSALPNLNLTSPSPSKLEITNNSTNGLSPRTAPSELSVAYQTTTTYARPGRLQLQVPRHSGAPVRLATPPVVLVNGTGSKPSSPIFGTYGRRTSADFFRSSEDHEDLPQPVQESRSRPGIMPDFTIEDVCRAFAASLLSAKLIGRAISLNIEEARLIAVKAVQSICEENLDLASTNYLPIRCAFILGVEREMGLGYSNNQHLTLKAVFQNSYPQARGTKQLNENVKPAYSYTISLDTSEGNNFSSNMQIRDIFIPTLITSDTVEYELGALRDYLKTVFEVQLPSVETRDDSSPDWKNRFLSLQREERIKEEKYQRMKRMVLEVIMAGD